MTKDTQDIVIPSKLYHVTSTEKQMNCLSVMTNKHYFYNIEYKAVHCVHITKRNSGFISLYNGNRKVSDNK